MKIAKQRVEIHRRLDEHHVVYIHVFCRERVFGGLERARSGEQVAKHCVVPLLGAVVVRIAEGVLLSPVNSILVADQELILPMPNPGRAFELSIEGWGSTAPVDDA